MNARVIAERSYSYAPTWLPVIDLRAFILLLLIFCSALAVIYVKDINRRLFIDYQSLRQTHNALQTEKGRLLLEQSAWLTQARVQKIAEQQLRMEIPSPNQVVILKQ